MGSWRGICSVAFPLCLCLCVCVCEKAASYREIFCCLTSLAGLGVRQAGNLEQSVQSPFASHVGKAWVPWVMGRAAQEFPRYPQQPPAAPGGSQSHLASPACRWVRACLVRLVLPLLPRVSVCQCVSDASAETNLHPCRAAIAAIYVGSLSSQLCLQLPLHWAVTAFNCPRFTKLSARVVRRGESHCLP